MSSFGKIKVLFISNSIMLPSFKVQNTKVHFPYQKGEMFASQNFSKQCVSCSSLKPDFPPLSSLTYFNIELMFSPGCQFNLWS